MLVNGNPCRSARSFIRGLRTVDQIDVKEMLCHWWSSMCIKSRLKPRLYITWMISFVGKEVWQDSQRCVCGYAAQIVERWPDMSAMQNKDAAE